MEKRTLNRRDFLRLTAAAATGAVMAACAPAAPQVVEVVKEVPVEKVVKETVIVEKEVVVEKPAKPEEVVELTFMWRVNPKENQMLEELLPAWEEKHPDMPVELILSPWDEFEPKLMTMYAAGIAPDIIGTGGTNPHGERFARGMVLALDPYMDTEPELAEDLFPIAVKSYTFRGKLIGLPMAMCYPGVFYNATLFDEAGVDYPPVDWKGSAWTWDDMIEAAKKLTLDKDGDGKIDQYGLQPGHSSPWYYTRLWGEDLISEEDYAAGVLHRWRTDDSDVYNACVNGLQARADAIYKHEVTPAPATAATLSELGPMLKTGVLAMEFTGAWALFPPLPEKFKFGAAANPLGGEKGKGTRANMVWVDPAQIPVTTKHPDAAWEFCKWMVADEEAIRIQVPYRANSIPCVQSGFRLYMDAWGEQPEMVTRGADLEKTILGSLEVATRDVPCHSIVGWAAIRDIFRGELEPVWLGDKSAKEAVDTMIPLVHEALEKHLEELGVE